METMQDTGRYEAQGYSFYTLKDAELAENEAKKIKYLETRLDFNKPGNVLAIYNKMIDEHTFKSPAGHFFLKTLQQYLRRRPEINAEQIKAIPMHVSFDGELRDKGNPARERVKAAPPKKSAMESVFPVSIILNIALVCAIIAMFVITLNSEQPNVLNYERVITNQYASWEQELTERERAVKERERELQLVP